MDKELTNLLDVIEDYLRQQDDINATGLLLGIELYRKSHTQPAS